MDISVVIVNYNVRDFLGNALTSLSKALDGFQSEIFVVDNGSDDGSVEFLRNNFPHLHLIANTTNAGFAKANNQALVHAKGKYLLLLNPDTVIQEDTIKVLIQFFATHPHVGMAGCKILNPDGTLQLPCRRSFPTPWVAFTKVTGLSTLFPKSKLFARYNLTFLDPEQTYEVDAVSGSFMMLRREVYEKIGGLDETFFMYGEDLDWCFRVQQAGWKVYYVPTTSIIHYKGESTRRSDIDELKVFYNAMRLFVHKHHQGSVLFEKIIQAGIFLRKLLAGGSRIGKRIVVAIVDMIIVSASILAAEFLYRNHIFKFPSYAYPWALLVPSLIVAFALFFSGVYTARKLSVSRSFAATFAAFVVISSFTAFFKQYAFSRVMMIISGVLCLLAIPGWRLLLRMVGSEMNTSRKTLFGRRTLIVGADEKGQALIKKMRKRIGEGYSIVGLVDVNRHRVGNKILDVEVVGSIENISKVIHEYRISEVIFSSDEISYTTILSIIGKNQNRAVNFRLVPTTMEVIIGKTSVDQLDEIPFIEIEYNIAQFSNRFVKRMVDVVVSLFFLICFMPFVYFLQIFRKREH